MIDGLSHFGGFRQLYLTLLFSCYHVMTTEWLLDCHNSQLCSQIPIPPTTHKSVAVDIGSGTSLLFIMLLNLGYSQVHRVEVYPQPTLSSHPASPWHILDLCASTSLGSLRNIKIDLLTDKGTLDFLLADLPPLAIHNYLHNLSALCASSQSGTLVLISFQSPSLIEKLFASVGFSIVSTSVVTDVNSSEEGQFTRDTNPGSGYHSKVLIYTMVPTTPPVPPTNEDEIRSILDAHFQHECPMLSKERESCIRSAWAQGDGDSATLDLESAWTVLFTPHERVEYTYELFLDDLDLPRSNIMTSTSLTVEEGIEFLRTNQ